MSITKDFIEAHYTDFFKYAVVMLKNKNDAEDAVQETVFKLLRHSLDIDGDDGLLRYAFRVLQNECRLIYRSSWYRHFVPEQPESLADREAAGSDSDWDESIDLLKAVLSLPIKIRSCVYFYYYKNCTIRETAEITGWKENTIKSFLQRGRKLLGKELGDGYKI